MSHDCQNLLGAESAASDRGQAWRAEVRRSKSAEWDWGVAGHGARKAKVEPARDALKGSRVQNAVERGRLKLHCLWCNPGRPGRDGLNRFSSKSSASER